MSKKKSTSSEESSSGSTTESSSTSDSTDSTVSSESDSDTSSSSDLNKPRQISSITSPKLQSASSFPPAVATNNVAKSSVPIRQKYSNVKHQNKPDGTEKQIKEGNTKTKSSLVRRQRISKSNVYSSEDENTTKKTQIKSAHIFHKKNIQNEKKEATINANSEKKSPSSSNIKDQQFSKIQTKSSNGPELTKCKTELQEKNKSIFSPDNSSDSDVKVTTNHEKTTAVPSSISENIENSSKAKFKKNNSNSRPFKTIEKKCSVSTETSSSTEETSSNSSSNSIQDSSFRSSPPIKKNSNIAQNKKLIKSEHFNKNNRSSTLVLSDSDDPTSLSSRKPTMRKLTRSSSTRKSKHLTGKQSDSDSEADLEVNRAIGKNPIGKTKTKVKKTEPKTTSAIKVSVAISPTPEVQKCPIEGCDSSGHLSGNHASHFLLEACPIYHNMSTSECKDRTLERKIKTEEQNKFFQLSDSQHQKHHKLPTPEQKLYLSKIRDMRYRFKPSVQYHLGTLNSEKIKMCKFMSDRKREPNLTGLVPDYDLQLFREAQAIASEIIEKDLKDLPVGKGIKYILMGKHQMKVWYQSPYPEDAARNSKMYICEFCLRYQKSEISMKRHSVKCVWRHPPGDEIYRRGKLQVWQVDGKKHKQFCQNLCLLAKFFLDHKTLYYEVEPFLFYVMTLANSEGCHIVGYFSKEKSSYLNYNVSCILTLPPYQRKGYGRLLIDFSYLLTRVENKIGSPEKPLSDLGLISYRSYWKDVLLDFLCTRTGTTLSIKDLSQEMAINSYDIVSTLQALGMMKYWKGKHIVLKKQDVLVEYEERIKKRGNFPTIDSSCLRWNPFVLPQTSGST